MLVQNQANVLAFLSEGKSYHEPETQVLNLSTHISVIFFVGKRVFKLKRAVCLPYVDFSTVRQRLAACHQELALNRRTAPRLYLGVRRITGGANGLLTFDGQGELIDAVVEMIRFDDDTLFDKMARRGLLTPRLLTDLARTIARFHTIAETKHSVTGVDRIASVLESNEKAFSKVSVFSTDMVTAVTTSLRAVHERHSALLNAREHAGKVRHCHGDLHLRNICLVDGVPTLFDCLEFNEALATIDVLYDLAFVIMDLWHLGLKSSANLVLNRYLDENDEVDGLPLMPFFMAIRATILAHVMATQAEQAVDQHQQNLLSEARAYMALALELLEPTPPRLVAIGGLSGTGKSTVSAAIAHQVGAAPGARVLASDRVRKHLHGVAAEVRLPTESYQPEVSQQVYATLIQNAKTLLAQGQSVVVDAVFDRATDREGIEQVALTAGAPFTSLWLHAPPETLFARVDARQGDASDATSDVVRTQLAKQNDDVRWFRVETTDGIATTVDRATAALASQVR